MTASIQTRKPASQKQADYFRALAIRTAELLHDDIDPIEYDKQMESVSHPTPLAELRTQMVEIANQRADQARDHFSSAQISQAIDELKASNARLAAEVAAKRQQQRAPRGTIAPSGAAPVAQLTDGMYKLGDDIYKVQVAVHGSGNLYAKKLVVEDGHGTFEYAAGAIRKITPAHKLSLEDAKAFGQLYGVCCVCGKTLTDEVSIATGIGPVCGGRF